VFETKVERMVRISTEESHPEDTLQFYEDGGIAIAISLSISDRNQIDYWMWLSEAMEVSGPWDLLPLSISDQNQIDSWMNGKPARLSFPERIIERFNAWYDDKCSDLFEYNLQVMLGERESLCASVLSIFRN